MREVDGLQGRGEAPGDVVEIGGSIETAEGHIERDFGNSKGVAATGIRKAWQGHDH